MNASTKNNKWETEDIFLFLLDDEDSSGEESDENSNCKTGSIVNTNNCLYSMTKWPTQHLNHKESCIFLTESNNEDEINESFDNLVCLYDTSFKEDSLMMADLPCTNIPDKEISRPGFIPRVVLSEKLPIQTENVDLREGESCIFVSETNDYNEASGELRANYVFANDIHVKLDEIFNLQSSTNAHQSELVYVNSIANESSLQNDTVKNVRCKKEVVAENKRGKKRKKESKKAQQNNKKSKSTASSSFVRSTAHEALYEETSSVIRCRPSKKSKSRNYISWNPSLHRLRPVVIDGSNVAIAHGQVSRTFSSKGIQLAVNYFLNRGHTQVTAFVPHYRTKRKSHHSFKTVDHEILQKLAIKQHVVFTPSRDINGKCIASYDDRFIVKLASEIGGIIVSNDRYRDLINESELFRKAIEERLLMFCFVGDIFMVPDDPLGRGGPRLQEYLCFPAEYTGA